MKRSQIRIALDLNKRHLNLAHFQAYRAIVRQAQNDDEIDHIRLHLQFRSPGRAKRFLTA